MYCLNCQLQLKILLTTSQMVGCSNCKQTYNINEKKELSYSYKSKLFNLHYESRLKFKVGDFLILDGKQLIILNRSVWYESGEINIISDFEDDELINYYSHYHCTNEQWQLYNERNSETILLRCTKINGKPTDFYIFKRFKTEFKNFGEVYLEQVNRTRQYRKISMNSLKNNFPVEVWQNGVYSLHYFEGEIDFKAEEFKSISYSNHKFGKLFLQIEGDRNDLENAITLTKNEVCHLNNNIFMSLLNLD